MMTRFLLLFTAVVFSPFASADTGVLPSGVRALVYKHTRAEIPSSFSSEGTYKSFNIKETLGPEVIKGISPDVASAYNELYAISPATAESLNLGQIDLQPEISVNANIFALGWGLSDRLMVIVAAPVMDATVKIGGGFVEANAAKNAAKQLYAIAAANPAVAVKASALAQVLEQLPTIRGENVQDVLVNTYKYKPLGHWTNQGLGDTQLFLQARTFNNDIYSNGVKAGVEIPTGKRDDPDNLVDIPFGLGYYSPFVEILNDLRIWEDYLVLSFGGRYQYALPTTRTYRLFPSPAMPLTADKEDIRYKPGNAMLGNVELSTLLFKSFGLSAGYTVKMKGKDSIEGERKSYDYGILEKNTDWRADTLEFSFSFSTIDMFLKKQFPLPLKIGATIGRVISGRNTERLNTTTLNFQMYF